MLPFAHEQHGKAPTDFQLTDLSANFAVMREPVEQRRRHLRVHEHAGPFREVQVGRDWHARVLVQPAQQMEYLAPPA